MNKNLLALSLFSAFSSASDWENNWEKLNEVVWQSEATTVSKNSVIPVPENCPDKARIEFAETSKTDIINVGNGKAFLTIKFSANKSPDSKYWVIDSSVKCKGDGYECISNQFVTYKPEAEAVVRCMKYKGMTIRLGENGEPVIESDIPAHQEALKKAKLQADGSKVQ
ncbi:aspartate 1-decarboxylase [Rheinheimera pacifica]|uniref:hypothetical protein n=1 Tax=Rheinheimera pacifica TaxID=173990 RepID=UPI0021686C1B|nr:hypothetical protein [Rheinheimera pacifica]MCS4309694.1 aspartate 1-decarboxylase [Rheinheimera pacifica]